MVSWLEAKRGVRCGGGECTHAVGEALRIAGGEFYRADLGADSPTSGDYVWGTLLKEIKYANGVWTDSSPATQLMPGDIIQYRNTKFTYPTRTVLAAHHTSVVANVYAGWPTFILEQNYTGIRSVGKDSIDLKKLTQGYVRIYRPKARRDSGKLKFTLVNNMTTSQTYTIKYGTQSVLSSSLAAANTKTSFTTLITSNATTTWTIVLSNGQKVTISNAGGFEIYKTTSGAPAIRKLPQ